MSDIASQTKSIKMIFQNYYEVPKYQRDYVWDDELAINLLTNLMEGSRNSIENYFIGAIVLQEKDENTYYIVDGQQRLSTLFLIFIALNHKLKSLNSESLIDEVIIKKTGTIYGEITKFFRIRYNFTKTNELVKNIYENRHIDNHSSGSKRTEMFVEAYKQLEVEINRYFTTSTDLNKFYYFLLNKVHCLPFIAKTEQEALRVFDILNSKGVDLSTIDLLKNKLFTILDENKWDDFSDSWDSFLDKFEMIRIDKTKFLRYFTVFNNKEVISENNLYTEISEHPTKYGLNKPEIYLASLSLSVDYLLQLKNNDNPLNTDISIPLIDYINKLSTQSKQHIPLIMKLWEICLKYRNESILINGLRLIESFIFSNKLLKFYTGEIESKFNNWCIYLPDNDPDNTNDYLINERSDLINIRSNEVTNELHKADLSIHSKHFIKWCLIRSECYLQNLTSSNSSDTYMDSFKSFEIEHIYSKNKYINLDIIEQELYKDKVENIGNLTLLEKSLNAKIQDKDYDIKRTVYKDSKSFLTKSMHSTITTGTSRYATMYENLEVYDNFDNDEIVNRNRVITNLILKSVFS
jgi:uncharacterized protein with ParB-like and HNH nuclease domain